MIFNKFNDFFALNFKIFGWVGLRFDLSERSACQNLFSKFLGITSVLWSIYSNVVMFLYIVETDAAVHIKFKPFPLLLSNIVCLSRVLCIYGNYERFVKILKDLKEYFDIEKINDDLLKNAKIVILYNKVQLAIGIFYTFLPLLGSIIIYIKTKAWIPRYPLDVWYPYDKKLLKFYTPSYFIEILIVMIYTVFCGLDTLIMMIITLINHQLQLISKEFSLLNDINSLKALVDRHCRLTK